MCYYESVRWFLPISTALGTSLVPTWRSIQDEGAGFLYSLSESLALVDWGYPKLLEPVTDGVMIIVSDYSGQHKIASHEAHSFLITTDRLLDRWQPVRLEFRNLWLPDGRRISYKQLSEPTRWRALIPFLNAASAIRGNVITFLVDRRIGTFMEGGTCALAKVFPDCFSPDTKPGTMEKMFRLASFVAMLTAGLREEKQRSLWISDHDETLETFDRREQLGRLGHYLTFGLTRWRSPADMEFGTTESPHAPQWAEDAASIPDLVAGTCCQLSRLLPAYCGTESWTRIVRSSAMKDRRARAIGDWMATTQGRLRHILLRLELTEEGFPRSSAQFFAGAQPSMDIGTPT
jgi:hypothetical protein